MIMDIWCDRFYDDGCDDDQNYCHDIGHGCDPLL